MQTGTRSYIWAVAKLDNRIIHSHSIEAAYEEGLGEPLTKLCSLFDIERPIVLKKHEKDWAMFRRAVFKSHDFIDSVDFDALEVTCYEEDEE